MADVLPPTLTKVIAQVAAVTAAKNAAKEKASGLNDNKFFKFFIGRHLESVGDKMKERQDKFKEAFASALPKGIKDKLDEINEYDKASREKKMREQFDKEAKLSAEKAKEDKRQQKIKEKYEEKYMTRREKAQRQEERDSKARRIREERAEKRGMSANKKADNKLSPKSVAKKSSIIQQAQGKLDDVKDKAKDKAQSMMPALLRAPKGGVNVDGKDYKAGQFLPGKLGKSAGMEGGKSDKCCAYMKTLVDLAKAEKKRENKRDRLALEKRRDGLGMMGKTGGGLKGLLGSAKDGGGILGALGSLAKTVMSIPGVGTAAATVAGGWAATKAAGAFGRTPTPTTTPGTSSARPGTTPRANTPNASASGNTRAARAKPNSFKGKLARFFRWLARKSPKLAARVAARMAASTAAAATGIGFILTIVGSAWTAWELWDLYQEWEKEEEANGVNEADYESEEELDASQFAQQNREAPTLSRGEQTLPDGTTSLVSANGEAVASRTVTKQYDGDSAYSNLAPQDFNDAAANRERALELYKQSDEFNAIPESEREAALEAKAQQIFDEWLEVNWDAIVAAGAGRNIITESSANDPEVIAAQARLQELLAVAPEGTTGQIYDDYNAFLKSREVDVTADWQARGGMLYKGEVPTYDMPDVSNQSGLLPNGMSFDEFGEKPADSPQATNVPAAMSYQPGDNLSQREGRALDVYNAMVNAGFSDVQAEQITGQINRENGFQDQYLFGTHRDPANNATNLGMISWQGQRAKDLDAYMRELEETEGTPLFDENGDMLRNQDALNAQARFLRQEMETNSHGGSSRQNARIQEWLATENPTDAAGRQAVGGDFIRWRYNDPAYAHHNQAIDEGVSVLHSAQAKSTGIPGGPILTSPLGNPESMLAQSGTYTPPNQTEPTVSEPTDTVPSIRIPGVTTHSPVASVEDRMSGGNLARDTNLPPVTQQVASNGSGSGNQTSMVNAPTTNVTNVTPPPSTVHAPFVPKGINHGFA